MRAAIENWLLQVWYDDRQPPWYLRLLETIYRTAFKRAQKSRLQGAGSYRPGIPLIIVGNITAGGTGKTPLVIHLCGLAHELNLKPGIASTGYGRHGRETVVVREQSDTGTCGDEPVLLARRTGVPVVVAEKRRDAMVQLERMNLDLIISDDGLQQADLFADLDVCVIDGERGLGNGHLIPAGPLREGEGRLEEVNFVVTNGPWRKKPEGLDVSVMQLRAGVVCSLDDKQRYSVEEFRKKHPGIHIHAVAGIGNPQRFFRMLNQLEINADFQGFADHHSFTLEDFATITPGSTIIMTEKDAVKCRSLGLENAWYIPVETHLPDEFDRNFKDQLVRLKQESR